MTKPLAETRLTQSEADKELRKADEWGAGCWDGWRQRFQGRRGGGEGTAQEETAERYPWAPGF